MMALPASWRDLTSEELVQLLDAHPPLVSVADLLFAKWIVSTRKSQRARAVEFEAEDAYDEAFRASIREHSGKTLLAREAADALRERCRTRTRRANREQERLYSAFRAAAEAMLW